MIEPPWIQLIIPLVNKIPWSQNNCDNISNEIKQTLKMTLKNIFKSKYCIHFYFSAIEHLSANSDNELNINNFLRFSQKMYKNK